MVIFFLACLCSSCTKSGKFCDYFGPEASDDQCYCDDSTGNGLRLPIHSNMGHWARVEARLIAIGPLLDPYSAKPIGENCNSPAFAHWTLDVARIQQNIGSLPSTGELDALVRQQVDCTPASSDWKAQLNWWTEVQQSGVSLDLFLRQEYDQWYVTYIVIPEGITPPTSFNTQYCNDQLYLFPTTSSILEAGLNSALSAPADAENEELIDRCLEAVQEAGATVYTIPDC